MIGICGWCNREKAIAKIFTDLTLRNKPDRVCQDCLDYMNHILGIVSGELRVGGTRK